jgi:hypothetical protein
LFPVVPEGTDRAASGTSPRWGEVKKAHGVEISSWSYFAIGAPLTLLTIVIGVLWL